MSYFNLTSFTLGGTWFEPRNAIECMASVPCHCLEKNDAIDHSWTTIGRHVAAWPDMTWHVLDRTLSVCFCLFLSFSVSFWLFLSFSVFSCLFLQFCKSKPYWAIPHWLKPCFMGPDHLFESMAEIGDSLRKSTWMGKSWVFLSPKNSPSRHDRWAPLGSRYSLVGKLNS